MKHERALWSAVVLQARVDIDYAEYDTTLYDTAVAFFLGAGEWGESRQHIADLLELHPDDLTRLGREAIAARHLRDGVPPEIDWAVRRALAVLKVRNRARRQAH
jgi:hypothetical protein